VIALQDVEPRRISLEDELEGALEAHCGYQVR
jgi:hypothetical protein